MKLSELQVGSQAVITTINDSEDKAFRYYLLDLGLIPGVPVSVVKKAPLGDPIEIQIHGYSLSLRLSEAALLEVSQDALENEPKNDPSESSENADFGYNLSLHDHNAHPGLGEDGILFHNSHEKPHFPEGTKLHIAIIGQPNAGTTTLFNRLTGANNHVSNSVGATTEICTLDSKVYENLEVSDLPGIYTLSAIPGYDSQSRRFLFDTPLHAIINIVDITNIERSLYLTMQLVQLGIPMVLALNMSDEFSTAGGRVRINCLESMLGIPVVATSASHGEGIEELMEHALHVARYAEKPIPNGFHDIWEDVKDFDSYKAIAEKRYAYVKEICEHSVVRRKDTLQKRISDRIDSILLGKYTAIPIFIALMATIIWLTIDVIGAWMQGYLEQGVEMATEATVGWLTAMQVNPTVISLVENAIFKGVCSVCSFLPIVVTMFFFISILEDSGYMSRIAFISDKLLRRLGLSGRSIVPMLIGFGCSVPAVMATRTLPSSRDRKFTIMMIPYMSCSAKTAIYAFFVTALFPGRGGLVFACLYLLGITVGIIVALVRKLFNRDFQPTPFVMELPIYRLPRLKNVAHLLWDKIKDFVETVFSVVFVASVIIWVLETFNFTFQIVETPTDSMLAQIAGFISPVFAPLGLDNWRIVTSLITGIMAKEAVVSTMGMLSVVAMLEFNQALAMLVFCLLYTPCIATLATIKRELGLKWALFIAFFTLAVAWIVAAIVYFIF